MKKLIGVLLILAVVFITSVYAQVKPGQPDTTKLNIIATKDGSYDAVTPQVNGVVYEAKQTSCDEYQGKLQELNTHLGEHNVALNEINTLIANSQSDIQDIQTKMQSSGC